jgi:hypothetical protein
MKMDNLKDKEVIELVMGLTTPIHQLSGSNASIVAVLNDLIKVSDAQGVALGPHAQVQLAQAVNLSNGAMEALAKTYDDLKRIIERLQAAEQGGDGSVSSSC